MDVLKKIKSATLVESLVATVLIVIIFVVSSLIINNLLINGFNNNTTEIENRLYELEYDYQNKNLTLPYQERFQNWNIVIEKNTNNSIEYKAQKEQSSRVIIKTRMDE
ncbi:hypothetical protein [Flavobacterium sp.]|uniref:hypothetical protein n=1 Tax=Flavobacterium sp. TaxID=239 RepID=UPI00260E2762|nr:hypothetical protein [Flavobacterium sp.]